MEDDDYPRSPSWLKSTTNPRRTDLFRRGVSSFFFNLGSLALLILLAAFLLLVFAIPSLIRHSFQTFKPILVKRSWYWIYLGLVVFALAFGFLRRIWSEERGDERYRRTGSDSFNGSPKSNPSTTNQEWCGFSDQSVGELRRNRNSSSYPDLRELEVAGGDQKRFSDDTHLNSYRVWDSDHPYRRPSWKELDRQNSVTRDNILVNLPTKVSYASPPPPPTQPPVTLDPPAAKKQTKRTYKSLGYDQERMCRKGYASSEPRQIVAEEPEDLPPEPPSVARVMAPVQEMDQRSSKSSRERSGGNATNNFKASFSIKKKRKQKYRSGDSLNALLHHPPQQPPLHFQYPPPSLPPPPPSAFHNIYTSKKDKRKNSPPTTPTTYSYYPPPPPPPPPLPAYASRPTIWRSPYISQKPPMPAKINNIDNWPGGGESPMRPPLPPFKMDDLKYVVEGDYARLLSIKSFHNGPSDPEEVEKASSDGTPNNGDVTPSPLFCLSPDVDSKAGSFIAKVRAGMKLEKLKSYNKKQALTMSNLSPTP